MSAFLKHFNPVPDFMQKPDIKSNDIIKSSSQMTSLSHEVKWRFLYEMLHMTKMDLSVAWV